MSELLLIDTDILIDVGKGDNKAVKRIQSEEKKSRLIISCITEMELIVGCRNKIELKELKKFLTRLIRYT